MYLYPFSQSVSLVGAFNPFIFKIITDIKGEIDSNTIIVGGFNTPLTPIDRS